MSEKEKFQFAKPAQPEKDFGSEAKIELGNERRLETYIKRKIVESSQKINEGNNGVIGLLDLSDLPEEVMAEFYGRETDSEQPRQGKFAMKTLKIYRPGAGQREFNLHQRASRILAESGKDNLVKIPQMYYYHQLDINPEDTDLLNKLAGDKIDVSAGKFDVMIMDYIDGDDFNSYIFKEVIKHASDRDLLGDAELIELREKLKSGSADEKLSHSHLANVVGDLLALKVGPQQADYQLNIRAEKENHAQLVKFLHARGFRLDPDKLEKMAHTVRTLNSQGFYHRDLHGRNVMVDYDEQGAIKDYYLLDFGLSVDANKTNADNPYLGDDGKYYTHDNFLPDIYKTLTKGKMNPKEKISLDFLATLERMRPRIKEDARVAEYWPEFEKASDLETLSALVKKISGILVQSEIDSWEVRCCLLLEAAESREDLVQSYIDANLDKVHLSVRNKLLKLRSLI